MQDPSAVHLRQQHSCDKVNNQAPVTFSDLNTSALFLGVGCRLVVPQSSCLAGGTIHAATADLYSAGVTLSESGTPTLTDVGGPLWGAGKVSGVVLVTFTASDASGIKEQVVRSDTGQVLIAAPQACDFGSTPPCPQQPAGLLSVDTRRVSDGPHTFSLVVTDAAGNTQVATSPTVLVNNGGPPPPAALAAVPLPAGGNSATMRTRVTARLTGRRLDVAGTITRTGRVRVSWRSKINGRTVGSGSRVVSVRANRIGVTFTLSRRARRGTVRVAIRSGGRIVGQARAVRGG
jgi:hypothetical protein